MTLEVQLKQHQVIFKFMWQSSGIYLHRFDRGRTICIMYKFTLKINTYRIYTNSYSYAVLVIKPHVAKTVNVVLQDIAGFQFFLVFKLTFTHTWTSIARKYLSCS